jgi:HD-GYP domain-containing protein (c-di-GMP phosphodiesterase class II)
MRDPSNQGKSERVATYCLAMAKELGLDMHDRRTAWLSGMLHDLGLAPMSDSELQQAPTLTSRKNSNARKLLKQVPDLEEVLPAIENQDERYDGSGTAGKQGDDIPPHARILGLALTLDEALSEGDHGTSLKDSLLKLKDLAGRKFDRETVNALLIAYRNGKLFNLDEEFFEVSLD